MRNLIIPASVFLIGTILFISIVCEPVLLTIGDFLVIKGNLQPAEVIHVIAGIDYRADYGIHLYQRGYGRLIFFTGGWCRLHNDFHGQRGKKRALEQGLPVEAIDTDDSKVKSTYSEVVQLKEFIDRSQIPIHSVIIVSDPHHMRRARWAYRKVLGDHIDLQMAPVPFELSPYKRRWWNDKASRLMVWNEYRKFVYYYARYQLSWGPVRDWLASLDRD